MVAAQGQQKRSIDTHTMTLYTNGNHDSQSYLACENTSALKQPKLKETS